MQGIKANVMLSKRGELERTSIIWTEVIERDELESQQRILRIFKKDLD